MRSSIGAAIFMDDTCTASVVMTNTEAKTPGLRLASVGFVIKSRLYGRGAPSYISCAAVLPPVRMPPPDVKDSRVFVGKVEIPWC